MKTFKYEAELLDDGSHMEGIVEANNQLDAIAQLKTKKLIVTHISETGKQIDIDLRLRGKKTPAKILALVCNQFAIILGAGLPIVRTVELVANQTSDKTMKQTLLAVADDAAAGYSLAESFANHGKNLPTTFIETVRAGEESGNLDEVFRRLSLYFDKTGKTKAKAASAFIYPAFVCVVGIIVVAIIMIYAVPVFSKTFESMGSELPWITALLINSSNFLKQYALIILGVIVALVIGIKLFAKTENGRTFFGRLGLKVPIIGRVTLMNGASQYASTMSIMLSAGLSVIHAVQITGRSLTNHILGKSLQDMLPDLESGKRLGTCLKAQGEFPDLINEMTAVGEETGSLEDTLLIISEYYENEVEVATSRALSILEPCIIVVLAVFVVGVLLAVYLPLFSMYGSIS